jgi:hypothetical protein
MLHKSVTNYMELILLQTLIVAQLVKTFLLFIRSVVLILSFHLSLGLQSDLFNSGFLIKILYSRIISSICSTCFAYLILLDLIIIILNEE